MTERPLPIEWHMGAPSRTSSCEPKYFLMQAGASTQPMIVRFERCTTARPGRQIVAGAVAHKVEVAPSSRAACGASAWRSLPLRSGVASTTKPKSGGTRELPLPAMPLFAGDLWNTAGAANCTREEATPKVSCESVR